MLRIGPVQLTSPRRNMGREDVYASNRILWRRFSLVMGHKTLSIGVDCDLE